ncbi:GMC oxidoreductase [Plenodomus tracheiphilus IPT5]|uniref:GMC oxidoreductase n=1 Tax=Plenodomus tracheiphilus IPT5 TaxID=1408161 RepID=A0A6A7BIT0_9PLEO|nr:GMC oxidoreductase [Plenodomus tracheiphilus IPT5]
MPSMLGLNALSLAVALSATTVVAHPFFSGQLVQSAGDLLSEYDYIVVGAGASGLTVANRLSEEPITVLVIEAGEFDKDEDFVTIPGLAGGAVGTKYDWNISYAPDAGTGGRVTPIPLGKVVGGSTKLNRMVFDRGSKSDYDGWESLTYKGWNFAGLLPYFKKTERFTPPTPEIAAEYGIEYNAQYHGDRGYVQSTYSPFFWPTTKNIVNATKALGIPINDQATGNAVGGYFCPHNQDPYFVSRSSAEEAYYASAAPRSNFHLLTGNQVSRIVTNTTNGNVKVTAVEFATSAGAERKTVKVKQEAILAAGAIHTPQLLQVSGIGEASLLKSINVAKVVDLPAVGYNLHDHVNIVVVNVLNTSVLTNTLTTNATFAAQARQEYDAQRKGPLTNPTGDFLLFLPLSTYSNATQAIISQANAGGAGASLPANTPREVTNGYAAQYASLNKKLADKDSAFLEVIWADGVFVLGLQHPYSRGSVKAASSSMFDTPIADVGLLRNPVDIALLREGVHFARKVAGTPGITELNPFEAVPGANVTADADIDTFIRGSAATLFHPAGTCKLGPKELGGVVNNELKVYGVEGLRIVDASVVPILPASHTMTTVYAIAEKAADIIKGSKSYKAARRV